MQFHHKILAIMVLGAFSLLSMPSYAEVFKSSDFLEWDRENQEFYIETSVGMASLIAGQTDRAQGKCIDDWYYSEQKPSSQFVLDTMSRFPEFHPRATILAVIEKKCGELAYKK